VRGWILVAALVLGLATIPVTRAGEASVTQIIYEEAARYGVSGDWLYRVASCETGGTFDHSRVGRDGEIGIYQFLPGPYGVWSEIPIFRTWWDVYDLRLNIRGAAWAFAHGLSGRWSCK